MAARCLLLVWVKSAKGIPQPRANVFQERGRCWGILPSGGAVLGIVPGHGGHRPDRIFANLFWMGVMIWRK